MFTYKLVHFRYNEVTSPYCLPITQCIYAMFLTLLSMSLTLLSVCPVKCSYTSLYVCPLCSLLYSLTLLCMCPVLCSDSPSVYIYTHLCPYSTRYVPHCTRYVPYSTKPVSLTCMRHCNGHLLPFIGQRTFYRPRCRHTSLVIVIGDSDRK